MELLPDSSREFREEAYWDRFFALRDTQAFEWYLSSEELISLLQASQVQSTRRVLHLGTGNSMLPLMMYDQLDCHQQVALDFSSNAIEEMISKCGDRPGLEFLVGDVLHMDQIDGLGCFGYVIDKGLFDAMMPDEDWEATQTLFLQIRQVLAPDQHAVLVISLLQDHVLSLLYRVATDCLWNLHIEPLTPAQSTPLRPFLLKFTCLDTTCSSESTVLFNNCPIENLQHLSDCVNASRAELLELQNESKSRSSGSWYVELHLTPEDSTTDMSACAERVKGIEVEGLERLMSVCVVPFVFGLEKVVLEALIAIDEEVELVCEAIAVCVGDVQVTVESAVRADVGRY